jgi:hypothetical protein
LRLTRTSTIKEKKIDESSAPHFSPIKKMVSSAPHSLSFAERETHDLKQTKTCKIPQRPIWNESVQIKPLEYSHAPDSKNSKATTPIVADSPPANSVFARSLSVNPK